MEIYGQQVNPDVDKYLNALVERGELTSEDIAGWKVTDRHVSSLSGVEHIYFRQQHEGLEIYGTESGLHVSSGGRVVSSNHNFVKNLRENILGQRTPRLSASEAVQRVAVALKLRMTKSLDELQPISGTNQSVVFDGGGISQNNIPVQLVYQLTDAGKVVLSWDMSINEADPENWWSIRANASTGEIIQQVNWVRSCDWGCSHTAHEYGTEDGEPPAAVFSKTENPAALVGSYTVFEEPVESPGHGVRTNVPNPDHPVASPFGWHDTNGAIGSESTLTTGNNVDAFEDGDNPGFRPDGTGALIFDFPMNPVWAPGDQSEEAAITNLFYWNNLIHDVTYQYGFDEASGNFQQNNYGNPGLGGDFVNARGQINLWCNATFGTPPDGTSGTMSMYIGDCGGILRDGCFDNLVIAHEYGHGVSNRLTGGPANSGCLWNAEQMGEGWSDWLGLMLTIEPGDVGTDPRGVGTFLFGQGPNGPGIRTHPYSTDLGVNPHTYADITTESVPHGVGSVWSAMLWEMTWALIYQYGYDPDFHNGTGGNNIAMALVIEAMKIQPCSPGFVDGRDAILAADEALFDGEHHCLIWQAFAKRGLGFSADQGSSFSRADGTEAFDVPPGCEVKAEYCCEGQNLISHGSFENCINCFQSDYGFVAPGNPVNPGEYSVIDFNTATAICPGWKVEDHTHCITGANNKILVVNGQTQQAANVNNVIWQSRVTVERETAYKFCAFMKHLPQCCFDIVPQVKIEINQGGGWATILNWTSITYTGAGSPPCDWEEISAIFSSNNNFVEIRILLEETGNGDGNDLAMDDISLTEMQEPTVSISFTDSRPSTPNLVASLYGINSGDDALPGGPDCDHLWLVGEVDDIDFSTSPPTITAISNWMFGGSTFGAPWPLTTDFPGYNGATPGQFDQGKMYFIYFLAYPCGCYTSGVDLKIAGQLFTRNALNKNTKVPEQAVLSDELSKRFRNDMD